ncbi:MAG: hypothetical protein ACM3OB_00905 [Acidobacteriota bacterium]
MRAASLRPTLLAGLLLAAALVAPGAAVTLTSFAIEPRLPSTGDAVRFRLDGDASPCFVGFTAPRLEGHGIRIQASYNRIPYCPSPTVFSNELQMPPLAAGTYRVVVEDRGFVLYTETLIVQPLSTELALHHDSFLARLHRHVGGPSGPDALAQAVTLTDQSGYFWFFDPANTEVTIKILDGRAVNGHFWIFVSSLTDVAFTLEVEDSDIHCDPSGAPCPNTRTYSGVAGQNRNLIDLAAF